MANNKRQLVVAELEKKEEPKVQKKERQASVESQMRLAEILNDSPRIVSLKDTEWEIRALRMGTQWMIAKKVLEINKAQSSAFGDIIKEFSTNIPAVMEVITLALLNDKSKIFNNGNERAGYSDLYKATFNTLMWECEVREFGKILIEVLEMMDCSFFYQVLDMLQMFKTSVTEIKRRKTKEAK